MVVKLFLWLRNSVVIYVVIYTEIYISLFTTGPPWLRLIKSHLRSSLVLKLARLDALTTWDGREFQGSEILLENVYLLILVLDLFWTILTHCFWVAFNLRSITALGRHRVCWRSWQLLWGPHEAPPITQWERFGII